MCKLVTGFRTKKVSTFFRTIQNSQRTGVSTFASRTSPSTDQSLQKSFRLSHADKIELKKISSPSENKKYPTAQTNTTQTMTVKLNNDNGLQGRTDRTPAGNKVLPKAGVTNFYDTFVHNRTLVFQINSSAETPRLRQYPNRWRKWQSDTATIGRQVKT